MMPANEWWNVIGNYGLTVFPAQFILYAFSIVTVAAWLVLPQKISRRIVKGFLAASFGWIGIVFFLTLGRELPAYQAQTFLFVSLSVLFFYDLVTDAHILVVPANSGLRIAVKTGFTLVLLGYPLVGILLDRPIEQLILSGSHPCPTTALALFFMIMAVPKRHKWLIYPVCGLLLLWAIPFPIMIQIPKFGVYEDSIMLLAGLVACVVFILRGRKEKSRGSASLHTETE